jgi:TolC family type I secretion outer membrane protein
VTDRFEVGEVTRTDLSQAEARLSRARSDLIQAIGVLEISRANYENLVGNLPENLERVPALSGLPQTQDEAIGIALAENPSLVAARNAEQASDFAVKTSRGSLLPTVSVIGDLTHSEEIAVAGLESDVATITARVSVPLYQSGSEYSQVRQLRQTNNQRRIQVEEARRAVIEDVTQAWERLNTATARINSSADQVASAELALDGVRQEALVGSRTVLDVLDAEQELLDASVALVAVERDEYVAGFDLHAAIGRLTARHLGLAVEVYDPVSYYDAIRNKLIGTKVESQ